MRLILPCSLLLLECIAGVYGATLGKRDADFYSVRTRLTKDRSGKGGDPKEKYFHESVFHPHYDGRFADKELNYVERRRDLSNLMQTYLATMTDIGVETWIMHGSLLGWWWNRKIMPWDSDIDVQVGEESMTFLANFYNMTVFHYKTPRIPQGRDYLLEINPHHVIRDESDKYNRIDARWIDTWSGLFIDITTVRKNLTHPSGPGILSCKDGHEYRESYIFPLRDTFFEGQAAKIPYAYAEVLRAEYGEKSLTNTHYNGHYFDETKREWIPDMKELAKMEEDKRKKAEEKKKAEAKKKEDEKRKKEEEAKKKEDDKRMAEENRKAEELKKAEEKRKAEEMKNEKKMP